MRCFVVLAFLVGLLSWSVAAQADTEVKMSGDARIHANFWSKIDYTGWNPTGTQTGDPLTIWERFRLKADFITSEDLKFRLGIRVNDVAWGNSTFTVDNPAAVIEVYQAFMQFKWPSTDVKFTVGLQDMDLPLSVDWLGANVVLGGTRTAAAVVEVPLAGDAFEVVGGFTRLLDTNKDFDPTTTQAADEFDGYFLTLPITLEGFKATPWAMIGVAGRDADYFGVGVGSNPPSNETLAANLLAPATFSQVSPVRNARNVYWWVGTTVAVTALDPFKFYADIIYGSGNDSDRAANRRRGLFVDVAAEYTGFDLLTPQATFWYSTGEDKSVANGSERLPCIVQNWGPTNSFLFNTNQEYAEGFMGTNPVGSWGVALGLEKISFVQDLSHRLVFTYARGTNSAGALREANLLSGVGSYVQMGRDLTDKESELAVNLDTQYNIYENLTAIAEAGWSHGDFQTSVWGHRFTNAARDGDAYKVAVGLKYTF